MTSVQPKDMTKFKDLMKRSRFSVKDLSNFKNILNRERQTSVGGADCSEDARQCVNSGFDGYFCCVMFCSQNKC